MTGIARWSAPALLLAAVAAELPAQACPTAGLTLPPGFCARVVVDELGRARHFAVAPNGDVLLAVPGSESGGVLALRDNDGDGVFDQRQQVVADPRAAVVRLRTGRDASHLYYGTLNEIIRYPWLPGAFRAGPTADTVVRGLPGNRQHGIKTFTLGGERLFVNVGAPSNSCQAQDRQERSPGMDPCPLLDSTAGIWVFAADRVGQTRADGRRWASGMRNTVALTVRPATGALYAVVHGRDQLAQNWGFSDSASAELPAEEFFRVDDGDIMGWPYCHYDPVQGRKVLGPEYGGDGRAVGRCADAKQPLIGFPAHWAPDGIAFYTGTRFPAPYRGGAFIAFHGSWNRAPLPQQGFNVVFVPFDGERPGQWRVFADGFQAAGARPVDVVVAPDGSLLVSDDRGGRLYRIWYQGR